MALRMKSNKNILLNNDTNPTNADSKTIIPRPTRIALSNLLKIVFVLLPSKREIRPLNISIEGIGLDINTVPKDLLYAGGILAGEVKIAGKAFPSKVLIRHITGGIVGCTFVEKTQDLENSLKEYLSYELQAIKLTKLDPAKLPTNGGGRQICLRDENSNEIFVRYTDSELTHFHITFLGMYIEGGEKAKVFTGILVEPDGASAEAQEHNSSKSIKIFDQLDHKLIPLALRFCSVAPELPQDTKNKILSILIKHLW